MAGVVPLGTEGGVPQRLGRAPGGGGTKGTRLGLPRPGEEAGGPESMGDGDEGPREARAGKAQGKSDLSWANSARRLQDTQTTGHVGLELQSQPWHQQQMRTGSEVCPPRRCAESKAASEFRSNTRVTTREPVLNCSQRLWSPREKGGDSPSICHLERRHTRVPHVREHPAAASRSEAPTCCPAKRPRAHSAQGGTRTQTATWDVSPRM